MIVAIASGFSQGLSADSRPAVRVCILAMHPVAHARRPSVWILGQNGQVVAPSYHNYLYQICVRNIRRSHGVHVFQAQTLSLANFQQANPPPPPTEYL